VAFFDIASFPPAHQARPACARVAGKLTNPILTMPWAVPPSKWHLLHGNEGSEGN